MASNLYEFMKEKACNTKCSTQSETIELGGDSIKLNNVCVAKNNEIVGIDGLVEIAAYPGNATPSSGDVDDPDMNLIMHVVIYMSMMSIDMKLTNVKDGKVIGKRSVVIGDTADDSESNKKTMTNFVHDTCNMLHWETDEANVKAMAKNVIERGIKELMRKAVISVRK